MHAYDISIKQAEPGPHEASANAELRYFKKVTGCVMQDALNLWDQMWGELQGQVGSEQVVLPEDNQVLVPSCGWPQFLEKMWHLKHYLDFTKRFSQ